MRADSLDYLPGNQYPLFNRSLFLRVLPHALLDILGDRNTRYLVIQEQGVTVARQRPDTGQYRYTGGLDFFQEELKQCHVEDRLGNKKLSSRFGLAEAVVYLLGENRGGGVCTRSDDKAGGAGQLFAGQIDSAVQVVGQAQQAHRVDIKNPGCIGVVTHLRRVAGQQQQVLYARRMGAQEFGLDADNILVTAGKMGHRFYSGSSLDLDRGNQRRDAAGCPWPVGNVYTADLILRQPAGFLDNLF